MLFFLASFFPLSSCIPAACVLARSLRKHKTTRALAVLASCTLSPESRAQLADLFDHVIHVEELTTKGSTTISESDSSGASGSSSKKQEQKDSKKEVRQREKRQTDHMRKRFSYGSDFFICSFETCNFQIWHSRSPRFMHGP